MAPLADSPTGADPTAGLAVLVKKDLIVFQRRDRFFVFGAFLLTALQTVRVDEVYFFVGVALALVLAAYVPALEWFHGTDAMLHSLPVSPETVVEARFVASLLAAGTALVCWIAAGWLLRPLLAADSPAPALWMTLQGTLAFFTVFCLLAALLIPLYFGLGAGRALVALLVLLPPLILAGYLTAGVGWGPGVVSGAGATSAPGAATGAAAVPGTGFFPPSALVTARLGALREALGSPGAVGVTLVGLGGILYLSLWTSVLWLRRREF
jgi:hypothetical protein